MASWGERPEVERTFTHHASREKIDAEHMVAAKSLIFGSMRRPVHEGPVSLRGGVGLVVAHEAAVELVLSRVRCRCSSARRSAAA